MNPGSDSRLDVGREGRRFAHHGPRSGFRHHASPRCATWLSPPSCLHATALPRGAWGQLWDPLELPQRGDPQPEHGAHEESGCLRRTAVGRRRRGGSRAGAAQMVRWADRAPRAPSCLLRAAVLHARRKLTLAFSNHCCARGDESRSHQCTKFSLSPFVGKGDSLKYQSEMFFPRYF